MRGRSNYRKVLENDAIIWQKLKQGDKNALELIFKLYHADLYRYAVKLVGSATMAEDHIQDLFLKIWNRRDNLGDVTRIKTYLWTALRRSLMDEQSRRSVYKRGVEGIQGTFKSMQLTAEEVVTKREQKISRRKALEKALDQLSAKHKEILYLKYFEGMTYEEIEMIMSISYQTARNYVCEGLGTLKSVLRHPARGIFLPAIGCTVAIILHCCLMFHC